MSVTYGSLRTGASKLARFLKPHLPERRGRVGLFLPPSPEFAVALFATVSSGAAAAPFDLAMKGLSLIWLLSELKPDVLLANASAARKLSALGLTVPIFVVEMADKDRCRISKLETSSGVHGYRSDEGAGSFATEPDIDSADDAILLPTSGTTGTPKFVRLSHRAVVHNIQMHLKSLGLQDRFTALHAFGVHYSYGLVASFLSTLFLKGSVLLPGGADARQIFDTTCRHRPDVMLGTPSLFRLLLEHASSSDLTALGCIPKIGIGGDRCPPPLRKLLANALSEVSFFVTYGLTEAGPRVATLEPALFHLKPESVGLPLEGVEVMVTDGRGNRCPANTIGRLLIKTPSLMNGYLEAGQPNDGPKLQLGWYDTGDLGSMDHDGHLFINGRSDRQIKFKGRRMNPSQIEHVLENHPQVLQARIEHVMSEGRDHLRAVVHHRPYDLTALKQELSSFCRKNLPASLVPKEIWPIMEDSICFFKGKRFALAKTIEGPLTNKERTWKEIKS
jgi:long-chain acyl-CoA synthetase